MQRLSHPVSRVPWLARLSIWRAGGVLLTVIIAFAVALSISKRGNRNLGGAAAAVDRFQAQLENVNLSKQRIIRLGLPDADLAGANLSAADLTGAVLNRSLLENARLVHTRLVDANLAGAQLSGSNLSGADLTGACLRGAVLRNANLERAVLGGADLEGTDLRQAIVTNATFVGATYDGNTLWPTGKRPAGVVTFSRDHPRIC